MKRSGGVLFTAGVTACLLAIAYLRPAAGTDAAASPPRSYDPLVDRPNEEGDPGELIYRRYCAGCHGVNGDGKGPAAHLLSPRPRDFTLGLYKFTTTPANSIPLDEDILRAITEGLHGTSMPSWRLLPLSERRSLVRYVRGFHKEWHLRSAVPAIPFHENPFDMEDPASIEGAIRLGREVYHKQATCWACHAGYMEPAEIEQLTGVPACPLVYAFLARAAASPSVLDALLVMAALALGTAPVLIAAAAAGAAVPPLARARLPAVSGALLVALGLWTIWRGWAPAPCCAG